jgi:hypothetical protein
MQFHTKTACLLTIPGITYLAEATEEGHLFLALFYNNGSTSAEVALRA